jgi:general secretion pathway protein G
MRNQKGFTLIELLIVIVIIGILAAVAIPRFQGVQDKARISSARAEMVTVRNMIGMYQAENDTSRYPETAMITSYAELAALLAVYGGMPQASEAAWTFDSYTSAAVDTFVLVGIANDRQRTNIHVTPTSIEEITP